MNEKGKLANERRGLSPSSLFPCTAVNRNAVGPNTKERTGFLTAEWTQKTCLDAGGVVDPTKKGNEKCCIYPDINNFDFDVSCTRQRAEDNWKNFSPVFKPC
ncbi:hypothetical protein PHMEG_00032539 [Phytophthora megakarya]|uniref:Uncharacterized protein n=1 Tax=Phytophthora megakarya TaxID=4795 RepID=A0A225UW26_9STRA|nr:hypothetical protein PHMEG_00032539 [Phytophthora megakarya]